MREIPLHVLLQYPAVTLAPLLREAGASTPENSKYCGAPTPPKLFPMARKVFGRSALPIYDHQVANQLHSKEQQDSKCDLRAVSTYVLNNPVPENYCEDSLALLDAIANSKNDEVVRSKSITLLLNRKWNSFAYKFYLVQFSLFVSLLLALTFVDSFSSPWIFYTLFFAAAIINTYFCFYEMCQIAIQKHNYFMQVNNIMDVTRLVLIFAILNVKSGAGL